MVIPSSLIRAGLPSHDSVAAALDWLIRLRERLPEDLLATPFPPPQQVLAKWRLSARTQNALARISEAKTSWCLADYLHRPGIGASAILDLLAAREENPRRARRRKSGRSDDDAPRMDPALRARLQHLNVLLWERLPLRVEALDDLLVSAGIATNTSPAEDLIRAYQDCDLPVPFRIVRRHGALVAVKPDALAAVDALFNSAAQLVLQSGVCTLQALLERFRWISAGDLSPHAAARILGMLPQLRWLDARSRWFSFAGGKGRVGVAIRKIFSVVERIALPDLIAAIGKGVKMFAEAPRTAIERYLVEVAECEITDGFVRPRQGFVPARLHPGERALVRVIDRVDGELTPQRQRALAETAGVTVRVVKHFLRTSPFVVVDQGRIRLAGVPRA